jgi:hypothetical protein
MCVGRERNFEGPRARLNLSYRLCRQELNAEVLDDVPGALWNRARLEELRWPVYRSVAELTRNRRPGTWYSELGGLNRWCHIWAYKDAAERFAARERARNEGVWPPRGGQPGVTLKQENMLVVPASFSPLH